MRHGHRAAGCISTIATDSASQHIWISDAFLADTYQRFTHCQRRRGSNVPGPLEARRRAAKRRNTNLAYGGSGSTSLDPAITFGSGIKEGWWQRGSDGRDVQTHKYAQTGSRVSPSSRSETVTPWFTGLQGGQPTFSGERYGEKLKDIRRPSTPSRYGLNILDTLLSPFIDLGEQLKHSKQLEHQPPDHSSPRTFEQDDDALQHALTTNDTYTTDLDLGKLNTLVAQLDLDLRLFPAHSETIFTHLLDTKQTAALVAEYLSAPLWNPPGSSNHKILTTYFRAQKIDQETWRHCKSATCRAIQMGLVSIPDLKDILLLLSGLQIETRARKKSAVTGEQDLEATLEIINAIQPSLVLRLKDLGRSFLRKLYDGIARTPMCRTSAEILWELCEGAEISPSMPHKWEAMTMICNGWLVAARNANADIDAFINFLLSNPVLLSRDSSIRDRALFLVTDALLADVVDANSDFRTLRLWYDVLSSLNSAQVTNVVMQSETISNALDPAVKDFDLPRKLVSTVWTAVTLYRHHPQREKLLSRLGIAPALESAFPLTHLASEGGLTGRVLLTLHDMPLPCKNFVASMIPFLTDHLVEVDNEKLDNDAETTALSRRVFMHLDHQGFYEHLMSNHNDELRKIAESINSDLGGFRKMSHSLIMKNKRTFKIILRILHHNRELKLLLSRSWPETDKPTVHPPEKSLGPAMATLVNQLAISFAISPVVGARTAFRKVYWCYRFLIDHSAPITPVITRALWHAGVTRYGAGGTSVTLLRWILHHVMETEGKEVARRLLWSTHFRDQRRDSIRYMALNSDVLSRVLEEGHGVPLPPSAIEECSNLDSQHGGKPGKIELQKDPPGCSTGADQTMISRGSCKGYTDRRTPYRSFVPVDNEHGE